MLDTRQDRPGARTHRAAPGRRGTACRRTGCRRAAATTALLAAGAASLYLAVAHGLPGPHDRSGPDAAGATPAGETAAPDPAGTARAPTRSSVPESGPGTFTTATAGVRATGAGRPYRVESEDGSGVRPDDAAERIAAILGHEQGWSRGDGTAFRQVADDSATLVIRIATPHTSDGICATGGLDTRGELNCRVGATVVVNLRRWQLGSPEFDGPAEEYRALIVNHEVGHWLGYGHRGCPGPGAPAPVMMQQIKGLHGCVSNAWPYGRDGTFHDGPHAP
ncbi:DUF3152 domain-containing protein [Streptomyces zhihengii]